MSRGIDEVCTQHPQGHHLYGILRGMTGLRLVLAGAAIGNGNRGVEALGRSVIDAVSRDSPHATMSILDDGWGVRAGGDRRYPDTDLEYVGVRRSRRWHRPESWAQIKLAQRLGGLGNPAAQRFAAADAVLDLSAGDSFTDLYGPDRLATVTAPKFAALRADRPLVLLPQTYGPFTTSQGRLIAERLVRSASLACARDSWSYQRLLELAGPSADDTRLVEGVDVAFALEPRAPGPEVVDRLAALGELPTAGVNASGLLHDQAGQERFGLAADYVSTMTDLVRSLLSDGAHVVFVPHVHVPGGAGESDVRAIQLIQARLNDNELGRTTTLPPTLDAAELKWCIGQLDWFVGSRMHSTIAALSTLTPAAAYAYSDKTLGVFQTCGAGDEVVDARTVGGHEAAERMRSMFHHRAATADALARNVPSTVRRSRDQLRTTLEMVSQWHTGTSRAEKIA